MKKGASSGLKVKNIGSELVVTGIIEESPAHSSGLKVGDQIKAVNGETTKKISQKISWTSSWPSGSERVRYCQAGQTEI